MPKDTVKEGTRLHENKEKQVKASQYGALQPGDSKAFPVNFFETAYTKEAENLMARAAIANQTGGEFYISDADVERQIQMDRVAEVVDFDNTFASLFSDVDWKRPAELDELMQRNPDYYRRREEFIDVICHLQAKAAKIRLRGWKSRDDFIFHKLVATGRITLPIHGVNSLSEEETGDIMKDFAQSKFAWLNGIAMWTVDRGMFESAISGNEYTNPKQKLDGFGMVQTNVSRSLAQTQGKWMEGLKGKTAIPEGGLDDNLVDLGEAGDLFE